MTAGPERRGRVLADLYARLAPRLFADLAATGRIDRDDRARREWECFALYACVRGLVAGGGFNAETALALEAFHAAVLERWTPESHGGETEGERRRLIAERYREYGEIGQAGGAAGAASVTARLGAAAARRMTGTDAPSPALCETVGELHESLVEGVAAAVREM